MPNGRTLKVTLPDGTPIPVGCIRSANLITNPGEPVTLVLEVYAETE
jgi:hypothetical protein